MFPVIINKLIFNQSLKSINPSVYNQAMNILQLNLRTQNNLN